MRDPGSNKYGRRSLNLTVLAWLAFAVAHPLRAVLAHASVVKSEPPAGAALNRAPARVTAWFDAELEEAGSSIAVFDADGRQVDDGNGGVDLYDPDHASISARMTATIGSGRYVVRWSATSAADNHDGHPSSGEFGFEIQ